MARQGIGTGSSPNDGTGDTLRAGAAKVNDNFSELYTFLGDGSNLTAVIGSGIATAGGTVGTGATILDFRGSGISTVTVSSGIATINITGGGGSLAGVAGTWAVNSTGISTNKNVGIGTTTASSALTVSGDVSVSGVSTLSGGLQVSGGTGVSNRIELGNSQELTLQYNTSTTKGIISAVANPIDIQATTIKLLPNVGENGVIVNQNSSVELYHDNNKKFETLGAGVTITGNTFTNQLSVSGVTTFNDKTRILDDVEFHVGTNGVSGDYKFYRDSGNSYNIVYEDISGGEARFIGNVSGSGNESNFTFLKNTNTLAEFTQNGIKLYANNSEKLTTTGSGVNITGVCTATSFSGDGSALSGVTTTRSRTVVSGTTGSVGAAATTDLDITGFKSYGLLKVGISSAAWVRLYVDDASRTSDETRSYLVDPTPGSGLIAEVRTETAGISTFLMSPGIIGWNNDVSVGSTIYAAVTNNESSSATITVDLTVVKMED